MRESAVAALVGGGGEELVVYVTAAEAAVPEPSRLHELLRTRLPEYMVPGYIEVLESLPTQVSGKVDRKQLPPPSGPRIVTATGPVVDPDRDGDPGPGRARRGTGPGPDQVSVEADFFDELGGHSLLAARVVTLLRESVGVGRGAAVRDLYDNPTVRGLAATLDTDAEPDGSVPPPRARSRCATARAATPRPATPGGDAARAPAPDDSARGRGLRLARRTRRPGGAGPARRRRDRDLPAATLAARSARGACADLAHPLGPLPDVERGASAAVGADLLLSMSPLPVLSGNPLAAGYLRLLGARVGRDVHLGTSRCRCPRSSRSGTVRPSATAQRCARGRHRTGTSSSRR